MEDASRMDKVCVAAYKNAVEIISYKTYEASLGFAKICECGITANTPSPPNPSSGNDVGCRDKVMII